MNVAVNPLLLAIIVCYLADGCDLAKRIRMSNKKLSFLDNR